MEFEVTFRNFSQLFLQFLDRFCGSNLKQVDVAYKFHPTNYLHAKAWFAGRETRGDFRLKFGDGMAEVVGCVGNQQEISQEDTKNGHI